MPRNDMTQLFEKLKAAVDEWRKSGYPCGDYPLIGDILAWQTEYLDDNTPTLKYLREPQFLALEVYWYVRLILKTPKIVDLYKHFYGADKNEFFKAIGIPMPRIELRYAAIDAVINDVKNDEEFVKSQKLDVLHEAVNLDYPSYILALAMGAGKTVLIGAIIATEFAMSLRYPQGAFMKNALVFAPGTTIIESLREISDMPFDKILPPSEIRGFLAHIKIVFADAKGKTIQAQTGGSYHLIVTNTEKISLRAIPRKNQDIFKIEKEQAAANLRLQKIASLPALGIFSDEAHHTYGNTFDKMKRVRETINHIGEKTDIVAVINTTGTPYYKREMLKDVIVWYGLSEGIKENILKEVNVHQYEIDKQPAETVMKDIIHRFFDEYGKVTLPNGAKAKIAFYFKTQDHLDASRRLIEQAMAEIDESPAQILTNTQLSAKAEVDEFIRLNNPGNQKRVILLVGKGGEGWNCPSLFACALIKEQGSNNHVLQAATRCLRQTPGNLHPAKVFIDWGNTKILNRAIAENFGAHLNFTDLGFKKRNTTTVTLRILKTKLPELEIVRTIRQVVRKGEASGDIQLRKPKAKEAPEILQSILAPNFSGSREILSPTGDTERLKLAAPVTDCHAAAWEVATRYHLPIMPILKKLKTFYPRGAMPNNQLLDLFEQAEKQLVDYEVTEKKITEALALIRLRNNKGEEVFEKDDDGHFVHRLRIQEDTRDKMAQGGLFVEKGKFKDKRDISYHYTPYDFDSAPERQFFEWVLSVLNINQNDVSTFLFTGGLTDADKTDFHFEYLGTDNRYHRYFPDFVLVKKSGEFFIVEVKADSARGDATVVAKQKAIEKLREMQPDKFKYNIVYAQADDIKQGEIQPVLEWIRAKKLGRETINEKENFTN